MMTTRTPRAEQRNDAWLNRIREWRAERPRHERFNSLLGVVLDNQADTWAHALINFSRGEVGTIFSVANIVFHNLLSAPTFTEASMLSSNGRMARRILGMSLRRSYRRLQSASVERERVYWHADLNTLHSGVAHQRDFRNTVATIKQSLDMLEYEVSRWPQLPDSQFYGQRNQIMYLLMSLRNYPQETMTREDYTVEGEVCDAVDFDQAVIHDT